jgi:integrase
MVDGQRQSYYGPTRADALAGPERAANHDHRQAAARDRATVADFAAEWLAAARQTVKPGTHRKYASVIATHVLPTLGKLRLADVRPDHLTALYATLAKRGLGPTSVHHTHAVIGNMLGAAVDQSRITTNPARTVKAPRVAEATWTILSRGDAARLLRAAKGDRLEPLWLLALTTGMREGELLALQWSDVAAGLGRLTVNHSVARGQDGKSVLAAPKTRSARRTVELTPAAVAALTRLSAVSKTELVFPNGRGGILTGTNLLRQHFYPLLIRAGLPPMRFHDLRHTAATHLIEAGVPVLAVSQMLGHASPAITLNVYGHNTPRMTGQAVAAMAALYPVG